MGMVFLNGLMAASISVAGNKVNNMDREPTSLPMEAGEKGSGQRGN